MEATAWYLFGVHLDLLGFSHVTVQLVLSTLNEIGMISSYSNVLNRFDYPNPKVLIRFDVCIPGSTVVQ